MGGLDRLWWVAVEGLEAIYTDSKNRANCDVRILDQPNQLRGSHRWSTRSSLDTFELVRAGCEQGCGVYVIVLVIVSDCGGWFNSKPRKHDSRRLGRGAKHTRNPTQFHVIILPNPVYVRCATPRV